MSATSIRLLDVVDVYSLDGLDGLDVDDFDDADDAEEDDPDPATDASSVHAMTTKGSESPLTDLSERELLAELVLIEEQIRQRAPSDDAWPREPGVEPELLALFLRERAVRRHLHAERASMSLAKRYA